MVKFPDADGGGGRRRRRGGNGRPNSRGKSVGRVNGRDRRERRGARVRNCLELGREALHVKLQDSLGVNGAKKAG